MRGGYNDAIVLFLGILTYGGINIGNLIDKQQRQRLRLTEVNHQNRNLQLLLID